MGAYKHCGMPYETYDELLAHMKSEHKRSKPIDQASYPEDLPHPGRTRASLPTRSSKPFYAEPLTLGAGVRVIDKQTGKTISRAQVWCKAEGRKAIWIATENQQFLYVDTSTGEVGLNRFDLEVMRYKVGVAVTDESLSAQQEVLA